MPNMRRDVWKLGMGWSDTLLWYARAVRDLQTRKINDPTSWRYLEAMHGFDPNLWRTFGYLSASDELPPQTVQARDWKQCQHQTWYFLPWHRGYLAAFETIVRAAIVRLGGPADWALPYWNYNETTNPNAGNLPLAFQAVSLPDGTPNALFVVRRYGVDQKTIPLEPRLIKLDALKDGQFIGADSGVPPGFGGTETLFSHDGDTNGGLEMQPHNVVHGLVGAFIRGGNPRSDADNGLMSMPDTAALDPIFWLHHANIDRLWEVWLRRDPSHHNPDKPDPGNRSWLDGPADRKFFAPGPDGQPHAYTAREMLNTESPNLNYVYEDVSDPFEGTDRLALRMARLNVAGAAIGGMRSTEARMAEQRKAELMGANGMAVQLGGGVVDTQVRLDPNVTRAMANSFSSNEMLGAAPKEPDRVFLNLENIRGANDGAVFEVYVNLPEGADPAAHPELQAGVVALFGVSKASRADDTHGGNGITSVLEITDIVDRLHLNVRALDHLRIAFVPCNDVRPQDNISVGRVSVYREGH
jgi:tyrosinase